MLRIRILTVLSLCTLSAFAFAHGDEEGGPLHFDHPLVAESPSPDTKIRLDYIFENSANGEGDRHTLNVEGEYAFNPSFSIEVNAPYTWLNPDAGGTTSHFDSAEIALKYANFAFADRGLLVGGGIEFGLPTGDAGRDIGSDHQLDIEPYIDLGYRNGPWQIVGFASLGIPANRNGDDEADFEIGWNLAVLRELNEQFTAVLEFDGEYSFNGDEGDHEIINITPGLKVRPFDHQNVQVGLGVRLPLTSDREFNVQSIVSIFWHF
ncbi:MAG: hypothetical protein GC162_00150 [Planctomycetes bacterium]|nr:hypothetical protein [Planctomycetota bacterium]